MTPPGLASLVAFLVVTMAMAQPAHAAPTPSLSPKKAALSALRSPTLNPARGQSASVQPYSAPKPEEADGAKAPQASQWHNVVVLRKATPKSTKTPTPSPTTSFLGQMAVAGECNPYFAIPCEDDDQADPLTDPMDDWRGGDLPPRFETKTVTLNRGEAFVDALARAGVTRKEANDASAALSKAINMRRLPAKAAFEITLAKQNQTLFQSIARDDVSSALFSLSHRPDPRRRIDVVRTGNAFVASVTEIELERRMVSMAGEIQGSLFLSAAKLGAPPKAVINLANAFAYDVDFQRDIFQGDTFEAVFEAFYDEDGSIKETGDILYASLSWRGGKKEKGYYSFKAKNGGTRPDFFDANGQSAKRLLMKTPIDGARLSSGFGTRRHPVLGYRKKHKGVDFAAPRGTPIYAAGDGVVERANRYGSYGNYIRIRHSQGYKTAYAHLKGFKRGIRQGRRVEQGDVIGYVGTTGRSTGPHLHYEVLKKGVHVNPQKLKIATGVTLKGRDLASFQDARDTIDAMRNAADMQRRFWARLETPDEATEPSAETSRSTSAASAPVR
ncbi:MAG: M23 family metallopeptidase [Pseudomonadota bacterium]